MTAEADIEPAADANLARFLRAGYVDALDLPFLTTPDGIEATYRDVERRAGSFAGALRDRGVLLGDRVLVQVTKSIDSVALYLACLRMGAIYVPLNPAFTDAEQRFHLDDAQPSVVVHDPERPFPGDAVSLTLDADGGGSLAELAATAPPVDDITPRAADDIAAMLYTSGTTGRPKGAMLTHGGLSTNARALHHIWGFAPDDVLIHPLPIFHAHGLFVALHCVMLSGARALFLPRFDPEHVLAALPAATVMMAVPTIYTRLLADPRFNRERCANVRLFTSGSAPMTTAVHAEVTERTGHTILERYGMTETLMITSNPLEGTRVPGTVGFALPGYDVRVATDEGMSAPGETGVVEVRGPHLFAGYWGLPEKTAAEFRDDGYFITGDVGSLDPEGRLTLQGRAGDMIISGGENIYPKEIEQCLDEVAGVTESAVVGVPDPDLGEAVVAYLVTEAGFDAAAVEHSVSERLARFKHPRRYVQVDALPRNAMGKVQKNELRQQASG